MLRPLFRAHDPKASVTATGFSAPMGARVLRKILRYGGDGGVRLRCFTSAHITSLVRGRSNGEEVLR